MIKKTLLMLVLALSYATAGANPLVGNQPNRAGNPGIGGGVSAFPPQTYPGGPGNSGGVPPGTLPGPPPGFGVPGGYEIIGKINDTLIVRAGTNPPLLVQEGKTLPNGCVPTVDAILCGPQAEEWKAQNQKKVKTKTQVKKEQDELKKLREEWAKERAEMKQEVERLRVQLVGLVQQIKFTSTAAPVNIAVANTEIATPTVIPKEEPALPSATAAVENSKSAEAGKPVSPVATAPKSDALVDIPSVFVETKPSKTEGGETTSIAKEPTTIVNAEVVTAKTPGGDKTASLDYDQYMHARYGASGKAAMMPTRPGAPGMPNKSTSMMQSRSRENTMVDRNKMQTNWLKGKLDGIGEVEYLPISEDAIVFRVNQHQAKLLSTYARDMARDGNNYLVTVDLNRINQANPEAAVAKEMSDVQKR